MGDKTNARGIQCHNLNGKNKLEDISLDARIISKNGMIMNSGWLM
jgi:hypothetical protein